VSPTDSQDDEPLFDPRITSYPWPLGILGGVFAFLLGYVLMVAVVFPTAEFGGNTTLAAKSRTVGFIFYNAHFVPLTFDPAPVVGIPENYLAGGSTSLPRPVYHLLPIAALAVSGVLVAKTTLSDADISEYAMPGLAMTIGYLLISLIGAVVVEDSVLVQSGGTATWGPDIPLTLVYMLVFPLLVGTIGALAVGAYRNRDELKRRYAR
jgi:hypothetical protein